MGQKLQLDEAVIRVNAFITLTLALIGLTIQMPYLFYFLVIDFAIRGIFHKSSVISFVSKLSVNLFNFSAKPVFAPPKYFAARIGFIFSLIIAISIQFQLTWVGWTMGILLIICAALESFLSICVGCYVYDWFFAPLKNKIEHNKKN